MKKFKNLINILPIIFFSFVLVGAYFYPANVYSSYSRGAATIGSIVIIWLWYFISNKINNINNEKFNKYEKMVIVSIIILIFLIEYIIIKNLKVIPGWDFGVIYSNALTYFQNGIRDMYIYHGYFEYFPNNIMIFILDLIAIKIGSVFYLSPLNSCILMNTVFINLGIIFMYCFSRLKFGKRAALFSLIIVLFFLPIFIYIPIFYSDTFSFYIPIGLLLFLTLNCGAIKKGDFKRSIFFSIIIGILMFLGKEIKITSLIIIIAYIISKLIISKHIIKNKKKFISIIIILLTFIILEILYSNLICDNPKFNFNDINEGKYPYTHWLMMGTEDIDKENNHRNSYGGYNIEDYELTKEFKAEGNPSKKNIQEYIKRVKKMGIYGYYNYLTMKAVNAWTDGYYFSDVKIQINPMKPNNKIRNILFVNENTKKIFINFFESIQYSFIIILLVGYIFNNNSKKVNVYRLSCVGLLIFLLFWENRSRYIYNFIPIFIIIITEFYYKINKIKIGVKNEKN